MISKAPYGRLQTAWWSAGTQAVVGDWRRMRRCSAACVKLKLSGAPLDGAQDRPLTQGRQLSCRSLLAAACSASGAPPSSTFAKSSAPLVPRTAGPKVRDWKLLHIGGRSRLLRPTSPHHEFLRQYRA